MTGKLDELRARLERYKVEKGLRVIEPAGPIHHGPDLDRHGRLRVSRQGRLLCRLLSGVAATLFAGAVSANAAYAWSLGSNSPASLIFGGIGIASDAMVFVLPSVAATRWRAGRKTTALVGWGIYPLALAFALAGSIGFSALNIADVTTARAARTSPAIELAQRKLDAATAAVQAECRRVGPLCHARQAEQRDALADLSAAQKAVEAGADPQIAKAAQLVAWLTPSRPNPDDLAMARLALLTLLPQLGGLVLMVARR